ncbi:alpha/beta fold hydrolase [Flavobacterium cerinum]|uniref:Alpha/beta hydrolase n=1 Tax=Flavobacterium cerinum TaxID=2502784 RepID=A0A3S3Q946_9FLAO|nr:alpha/beta hydrolase [Flavobacterium cerinum]RWX00479.1 alpha/beta hydrolase [Flavobacterium cerinum]
MKTIVSITLVLLCLFSHPVHGQKAFNVVVKGKGTPVLLFPGFGCSAQVWDNVVEELSRNHELHLFTFAGFGNAAPIEMPWFTTIKDQIAIYVKENKLEKTNLVGHSLGGTLALWLASSHTDMFKKVIVIDGLPSTAAVMIPGYTGEKIPFDNPQSTKMLEMDDKTFQEMIAQQAAFMSKSPEGQKSIVAMMKNSDRKTYVYGYIEMLNLDLRNEIAKITVPVTVLAATFPDRAIVEKTYKAQFEKLPNVVIKYADQSAHFVMYDQPEWFLTNLLENID